MPNFRPNFLLHFPISVESGILFPEDIPTKMGTAQKCGWDNEAEPRQGYVWSMKGLTLGFIGSQ
jgi:hypothetical protein